MESNESTAMTVFRKIVMQCAEATLERRSPIGSFPSHMHQPVVAFASQREAS
jgi:hypothetical protein